MDVALGGGVLVALDGTVLGLPTKVLGILAVKLPIQRCVVTFMLGGRVDALALGIVWMDSLRAVVHIRFLSGLLTEVHC